MNDIDKEEEYLIRIKTLEHHLKNFLAVNEGECRFDHHGCCQTHYLTNPCFVAEARKFTNW